MKNVIARSARVITLLCLAAFSFSSCTKTDDSQPGSKKHWIKVYNNITLGDQENTSTGHFLKTQNGSVVKVENAQAEQAYLSMMFYTQYYGNYAVLTFPGNGRAAAAYADIDVNRLFVQSPGGIDGWQQSNLNTGEIDRPYANGTYMSQAEFDELVTGSWSDFDTRFRHYNSGNTDLSAPGFRVPAGGELYMFQINNSVRGFIRMKSVIPESGSGGSVRFDMIIEGGDDFSTDADAARVQPAA